MQQITMLMKTDDLIPQTPPTPSPHTHTHTHTYPPNCHSIQQTTKAPPPTRPPPKKKKMYWSQRDKTAVHADSVVNIGKIISSSKGHGITVLCPRSVAWMRGIWLWQTLLTGFVCPVSCTGSPQHEVMRTYQRKRQTDKQKDRQRGRERQRERDREREREGERYTER